MGLEKCPFCGQEIDAAAVKCFFCGTELNEESVEKQLEQLQKQNSKKAVRKIRLSPILQIIVILILICIAVSPWSSGTKISLSKNSLQDNSNIRLSAKVAFTGTSFTISNNDSFDWINVELNIISENTGGNFILHVPKIPAGQAHIASAAEFVTEDGIFFNPSPKQEHRFRIRCDIPTGEKGSYFAGWK